MLPAECDAECDEGGTCMSLGDRLASGREMLLFDDGPVVVVGVAAAYTLLRERLRNLTPIGAASEVCLLVTLLVLEPLNKWKQR